MRRADSEERARERRRGMEGGMSDEGGKQRERERKGGQRENRRRNETVRKK